MEKVACPFCKEDEKSKRGEGCCNCDHSGLVPFGEHHNFKTKEEAEKHNPEISYYDLNYNRKNGFDLDYQPFNH